MKKLLAGLLLLSLTLFAADPVVWRLEWNDPNPEGSVVSYRVERHTPAGREVLATITWPTQEWVIALPPGRSQVAVYATGANAVDSDPATIDVDMLLQITDLRVTAERRIQ